MGSFWGAQIKKKKKVKTRAAPNDPIINRTPSSTQISTLFESGLLFVGLFEVCSSVFFAL